jgi:lysophospholipase L1-like esterase
MLPIIPKFRATAGAALLLTVSLAASSGVALAQSAPDILASGQLCDTPKGIVRLDTALGATARRLALNEPVTIVAVGSSSTAGAGASSAAFSYPNRLADELKRRYPEASITVLNRGVNGEEVGDMIARMDLTVLSARPTLVIWQLGTNSVLRDRNSDDILAQAREGIDRIKAAGADVLLVDSQYAPRVLNKPQLPRMLELTDELARSENISVFRRFAMMRHWHHDQQIPVDSFITADGLHMNDWGYACFARGLADAMVEAISHGHALATAARPRR